MADPNNCIPHLLGVALDSEGVAGTQVIAINRTTRDRQIGGADSNKLIIFDAREFTSGYSASDVIEFENVGSSVGKATITINSSTGDFQYVSMDCAAAPTTSVNL